MLKITFYHDVLCAWCFLASARLRRIVADVAGDVEVEHRCFALAPTPEAIGRMFGDAERGKAEIMDHWAAAAAHPEGEVIQVEQMRERPFPYPYSMPGLLACKAAEFQQGQAGHWKMFDRVQRAHFIETRNIADFEVLRDCAADTGGLDLARWEQDVHSPEVRQAVERDLAEARERGITAVPTMIFDDRWQISGAVPEALLRQIIADILAGRDPTQR